MSISVKNVTKIYGTQKALDNVSFDVNEGEIVGFLGPNGAGKSTMMKIITNYIMPTEGHVKVCDLDVMEEPLLIKSKIGYLPESNPLYTDMYVKEFLEFIAGIHHIKKPKNRISEMIEQTGLTSECHKKIGALSRGYRQRVGLAQALIHDPEVLILDEPTAGLDPNQLVEIRALIKECGKTKTVLFSTHIMQEVEAICNRVMIINKGVIIANEKTFDLFHLTKHRAQLVVEFDGRIDKNILLSIDGILKAVNTEHFTWLIDFDLKKDVRSAIFKQAVAYNIAVLSSQKVELGIEEIFRELTLKS